MQMVELTTDGPLFVCALHQQTRLISGDYGVEVLAVLLALKVPSRPPGLRPGGLLPSHIASSVSVRTVSGRARLGREHKSFM